MNAEEFSTYANEGYNRIPIVHDVIADLETPLSVYLKIANGPFSYLLESAAQGGEKWGRYSIVGLPSNTVLQVSGNLLTVKTDGEVVEQLETDDPLSFIETYQAGFRVPVVDGLPRFYGGLVGYFGYDTVRYVERRLRLSIPPDPLGTPDIVLMVSNELAVYDNVSSRLQLISLVDPTGLSAYDQAIERLHALAHKLESPIPPIPRVEVESPTEEKDFISEFGENNFMQAVERIRDYTRAGDVMQVVLAQRMSVPFKSAPLKLYRALRSLNPSPYMYYMDLDDFHIVSSSPEILARVDNGTIVNPLAGTRRRGHSDEEDLALEQELLSDPKEIAEHLMLIDLGRNDVGRVAEIGTVEVTEQFAVERYSHVMHISSQVEAKLASGKTAMDVLRATLPVGTLSGAPKIRAMEIIDELEPVKRGIYGGAVGYLAWNGNMDTAIAIRTAVIKDDILYIEAGGGIVADSVPRLEWKESMNKGRAIFQAVRLVESGFQDDD